MGKEKTKKAKWESIAVAEDAEAPQTVATTAAGQSGKAKTKHTSPVVDEPMQKGKRKIGGKDDAMKSQKINACGTAGSKTTVAPKQATQDSEPPNQVSTPPSKPAHHRAEGRATPAGQKDSASKCFNCGEEGHLSKDCTAEKGKCHLCGKAGHKAKDCSAKDKDKAPPPSRRPRDTSAMKCFNCGGVGHTMDVCPTPKKPNPCSNCGKEDHLAKDCPEEKQAQGKDRRCFNCDQKGHLGKDCPQPRKPFGACHNCGKEGHLAADCTEDRRISGRCYICQQEGHASKQCPRKREGTCYNCGEEGHTSKDCPVPKPEKKSIKALSCHVCKKEGHLAKDCPQSKCYTCGGSGHQAKKCPKAKLSKGTAKGLCHLFTQGKCKHGAKCKFSHQ